jgi:CheY-like chemotaxis protein
MRRLWRVLLADDNDDFREMCAEYLTTAGYDVLQAADGALAIDAAIRRMPDLIVMDLEMPVMGGLEAIQRLGIDARTRAIPVIVLSADIVTGRARRVGCSTCLVKPCSPEELERIIRARIDMNQLGRASRG